MKKRALWKVIGTGIGLAAMDLILSRLLGLHLYGGSFLSVLGGWILTIAFVGLFFLAVRRFEDGTADPGQQTLIDRTRLAELARTLKKTDPKVFKKQMRDLDSQTLRMQKKAEQLDEALKNHFGSSRISYAKFAAAVNGGIDVFCRTSERILSRMDIFDADGYEALFKKHLEYTDAIQPYQTSFTRIEEDLKVNEQILQRFDRLQQEVRQLSNPQQDLDALPAMQELTQLIDQTKLYRQQH